MTNTTERIPPPPTYFPQPTARQGFPTGGTQALRKWILIPTERPLVTSLLLAALVIIYIPALLAPNVYDSILVWGAEVKSYVYSGEWWRLITATFLHAPLPLIIHILFNGYALYAIGMELEGFVGRARFAAIYFVSGLGGSVASFAFLPANEPSMGASGAIFGIVGALGVYYALNRRVFQKLGTRQLWTIIIVIALSLGMGLLQLNFINGVMVDNSAHIGGLIAGAVMGFVLCPRYKLGDWYNPLVRNLTNVNKGPLTWIAATLLALIVVAIFLDLLLLYRAGILAIIG